MKIATHDKTGKVYLVIEEVINCTNDRDGEWMYVYQNMQGQKFVRTIEEFNKKFSFVDPEDIKYIDRKNVLDKTE